MAMVDEVTTKTEMLEVEPNTRVESKVNGLANGAKVENGTNGVVKEEEKVMMNGKESKPEEKTLEVVVTEAKDVVVEKVGEEKEEEVGVQVEPKTGLSFPVKLKDGKVLNSVGMRKKSILGLGVKIYGFGMYANNEKLKELLRSKFPKAPAKTTKELFQAVIDSDVEMVVRIVIVFGSLTMNMVKKNFDEFLGASIKKLNGGRKDDQLLSKVMGEVPDSVKPSAGSVIEVTKLPGYFLQTKVKDEIVSTVQSELLCRAYINMYLGDDPFDKEAKERFGESALALF